MRCWSSSIIHETQTAIDENPIVNVRGIFLDISKAFDKVWYDWTLYKFKANGVGGELLLLLKKYFPKLQIKSSLKSSKYLNRKKSILEYRKDRC